jgi:hypothetical protein
MKSISMFTKRVIRADVRECCACGKEFCFDQAKIPKYCPLCGIEFDHEAGNRALQNIAASKPRKQAKPILVIAGNQRQFEDYKRTHPDPGKLWYASSMERIRGISAASYVMVGTYWEHPEFPAIEDAVRMVCR